MVFRFFSEFSKEISALKVAPGLLVKLKYEGEHVSIQSTSTEKIRQHNVYRPSTKNKYKELARGRTPKLGKAVFSQAELRERKENSSTSGRNNSCKWGGGDIYRRSPPLPPLSIG
ncbi:hypothetical protein Taro_032444 [Colocasia esculenta]|uniref:Uncharacterized protein n=1 Tax=Colocasia esculenta TaxID=4460 RepID=A0A843VSN6_COLES|nr:hypothetical protein [Colocasia esculenta]